MLLDRKPQIQAIATILRNAATSHVDFCFYLDRLAAFLIEKALDWHKLLAYRVVIPVPGCSYDEPRSVGSFSAVVVLRGGPCLGKSLRRTVPDCLTGRMLIHSNYRTGEPELHYLKLFPDIAQHETVMLLDPQMSSGGWALMAVWVLRDHGVTENRIIFVTCLAGRRGVRQLLSVYLDMKVVTANVVDDHEKRWVEERYFECKVSGANHGIPYKRHQGLVRLQ